MARRRILALLALAVGTAALARTQSTGMKPGDPVPSTFRSFIVVDDRTDPKKDARNRTNRMHDLVTENGLHPAVIVFSRTTPQKDDAPVAKLIKQLDTLAVKHKADRLGAFVQFLTLAKEYPEDDQRDERAKAVRDLAGQLKAANVPLGLAAGASDQVKAWGLGEGHDLTVVLINRMKLRQAWTFTVEKPATDDDIKKIVDAIETELKQ
jgi:hypothetical protein